MSIAATLETLRREGKAIPQNPPNVNLSKLSLPSSLSDRAASARNALTILSTADPILPTLEQDLHLFDTSFDRITLSTDSQKALTSAITRLALRLTPVFLTRPCTPLLEWLLQTLQLPVLGTTEEIDALMLCALPFHQTEQFLVVARTLLGSPNAKKWIWLQKRLKTGRLVDTSFCVENAPQRVFKHIIDRSVECVKEGVAVAPLAALVTNFVARRMASDDCPVLAVLCVDAVLDVLGAKGVAEHLLCALFSALAAAVSYGLELQVVQTIASAAAQVLSRSDNSSSTVNTSVALLALSLRRYERCLSSRDARMILKMDNINTTLLCLGPRQSADMYGDIIKRVIASGTLSGKRLRLVEKALQVEQLLSAESTSSLLETLLECCAKATDESEKFADERTALLASLLTSLFKGRFSDAVEDVLHHHLVTRRIGKRHKKDFHIIDTALSKALDAIISGQVKDQTAEWADRSYPLGVDLLCLSHPDKKRRKIALESIRNRDLVKEGVKEEEFRRLVARLKDVIQFEEDVQLVATALDIVTRMSARLVSSELIRAALLRCSSKGGKDSERGRERDKLALSVLRLCEKVPNEQRAIVSATLLLLSCEGLLGCCCEDVDGRERIRRLLERFDIPNGGRGEPSTSATESSPLVNDVTEGIANMILNQTDHFRDMFSTVADIHDNWIEELSGLWLKLLWTKLSAPESPDELEVVSQRILGLTKLHPRVARELVRTLDKDVESVLGRPDSPKHGSAVFVWKIASELTNWHYQEKVLAHLVDILGLSETIDILKSGCFDLARTDEARKRGLEWYINFCVVHPNNEIGKEAVVTVSRVAYGDDLDMRVALNRLWSRRSELNRKKREKKCVLWDFLKLLSSLPQGPSPVDPIDVDAKLLCTEMQELARDIEARGGYMIVPLCDASFGTPNRKTFENHLASKLLSQTQIQVGDLYLLRALGGGVFASRSDREKLYSLLESTLLHLDDSDHSLFHIESVYRLAMLIISSGRLTNPNHEVRRLSKALVSTFKAISAGPESPDPTLTTSLLCLMGYMLSYITLQSFPEKDALVETLLAHSILSTDSGACARRIANSLAGDSISAEQLHHHLKNLICARHPKSAPSPDGVLGFGSNESHLPSRAALGAVSALHQWLGRNIDDPQKMELSLLLASLNELWKLVKTIHQDRESLRTSAETHESEHLSVALNTLATLHRAVSKRDIAKGRSVAMEADFDALIGVTFGQDSIDFVNDLTMREVRDAGIELVVVLMTSLESIARHVLPKILQSEKFVGQVSLVTKLLDHVMPTLISQETDLPRVAEVVADAAYNETSALPQEARMSIIRTLLSSRVVSIGALEITKACLREVYKRESRISSPPSAAKECSSFLQEAGLVSHEDIDCMLFMEDDVNCRITSLHFVSPEFLAKLGSFADNGDTKKISLVEERLSRLFVVLLKQSASTEKSPAIRLLLASIPLSGIQLCARAALESEPVSLRIEALRYLGERIGAESLPLFPTWGSISDQFKVSTKKRREIEASFLDNVGSKLCDVIKMEGISPEETEIREVATDTLRCLSQRLGSVSYAVIQDFASRISVFATEDSDIVRSLADESGKDLVLRGKVLECLASLTATLAKYSLPFVPHLLESSFVVLEEFCGLGQKRLPEPRKKNYDASVFVTAASIKALSAVLTSCPMFFGGKALKRLVLLALQTEVEAPREVLRELAAREVPVDVFVSVFGRFATVDDDFLRNAPVSGLVGLVESVASGVGRMYRSETKLHCQKILNLLLRIIDCARDMSVLLAEEEELENGLQLDAVEQSGTIPTPRLSLEQKRRRLEKCDQLDAACAKVLVKIVLKLSESDFETVFKALLRWFDGGSLPDAIITAVEDRGAEIEKNISRALPFFVWMEELLSILKTIMTPYFVQLITRLTTVIGRKIPKDTSAWPSSNKQAEERSKKRNRATANDGEACFVLISQQKCLREMCLKLVASFFNHEFEEGMMNTRLIGELQAALLLAFDDMDGESEGVSKALQGVARRMLMPDISGDSKKNQDMLISLVREVLSRTRDANAKLRAGALNTCKDMAMAVGDEFLATLPESMPILAEVIDDEESVVSKAAERYVLLLESMADEPILQQLK